MKKNFKKVNAAIIVIGNEILSGRTQDLNVSFISKWLNEKIGISVNEVRVIPDIEKKIVNTINELRKRSDKQFITRARINFQHKVNDYTLTSRLETTNYQTETGYLIFQDIKISHELSLIVV